MTTHAKGNTMDSEKLADEADRQARPTAPMAKRLSRKGRQIETKILDVAINVFANCGYEGSAIAAIAEQAGLSKQNLMYYFPTKQLLYQRVLDDVLDDWLERMASLADENAAPQDMLRNYIVAKLRFSREQPAASRVYAMEVVKGAQLYGAQIERRVVPLLRRDIAVFERWIAAGKIAPVNATHLLFTIWAMTQSYADFGVQMALVLERKQLTDDDFNDAEKMIVDMVLAVIRMPAPA
ncbi:MAG: TetR/AcrR family transcriptional regulator [Janthinobacterium sp.]|jgi:TetR/AcrR family transcriptional regulator